MKKYYFIAFVSVLLLGGVLWIVLQNTSHNLDKNNDVNSINEQETSIESSSINEEESTDFIFYLKNEKVDEIEEFSDFLSERTTAYDNKQQEEQYLTDFYNEFIEKRYNIFAIEIEAEDINGDEKDELLIIVMYTLDQGDLYVFHEQDGRLYVWEILEDFFTPRSGEVYLLKNGTFEFFGGYGYGHFFKRYNAKGEVEDVLRYYYNSYPWEEEIRYDYAITIYEQGVSVKELQYSVLASAGESPGEDGLFLGTREDMEECDRIMDEFFDESERILWFSKFPQYEDGVKKVSLDSILGRKDEADCFSADDSEENWEYLIQPGEYEEIKLVNSNLIAVKDESGNYGIINRNKDSVTDFEYFNVWGNEESILVMDQNKKFCILDCEGNLISKETYDRAELFCEGLAAVKKEDKWGFIDRQGNLVIDYQYDNIYGGFSQGLIAVEKESVWRFIGIDGEWAFDMDFEEAHTFSDGLAAVKQNGVWGFIDLNGEMVIEGQYDEAGNFGEGLASVCKEIDGVRQWGYIDKAGNVCIDFQPYDVAEGRVPVMGEFHDGYAMITDTLYCLIDKNGQCVLGKEGCFLEGGFDYSEESGVIPAYDYEDENMMIKKYGLVDINGNEIIPFMFCNISDVQGDLIAVASEEDMITNGVIVLKH